MGSLKGSFEGSFKDSFKDSFMGSFKRFWGSFTCTESPARPWLSGFRA